MALTVSSTLKRCTKCLVVKPLGDFPNDKSRPSGKFPRCKACGVEGVRQWRQENPEKDRDLTRRQNRKPRTLERKREWERQHKATLKRLYGVSGDDYRQMLEAQNHCCALCGRHESEFIRQLSVDHDHITGAVRALLCVNCNAGIGNLGDDPDLLRRAADYIERFK